MLPSRLFIEAEGFVTDVDGRPVNVRSVPRTTGNQPIDQLQVFAQFEVIDGPECSTRYTWYKVRYAGILEGWIAEGDATNYFVAPVSRMVETPTPIPGSVVDPRLQPFCNAIVEDTFDGNQSANDWFTGIGRRTSVQIEDDAYVVSIAEIDDPSTDPVSWGSLRGVEIGMTDAVSVEAIIRAAPFNSVDNSRTGLWMRYQDESNFLAFMLRSDGSYRIARFQDTYIDLVGWRDSAAINTGDNAENVVRIDVNGAQFDLYINGQFVERAVDNTWDSGRVVFWGSSPTLPAIFSMDYFRICRN